MSRITRFTRENFGYEFFFDEHHVCMSVDYRLLLKSNWTRSKTFKSWLLLSGAEQGFSQTRINGDIREICNLVEFTFLDCNQLSWSAGPNATTNHNAHLVRLILMLLCNTFFFKLRNLLFRTTHYVLFLAHVKIFSW